jgi:hypothetical protein
LEWYGKTINGLHTFGKLRKKSSHVKHNKTQKTTMSFDLPQDVQQLPVSQVRQANSSFIEYLPTSSATGQNFSNGEIVIPWALSSPLWWDPKKSYVRMVINTSQPIALVSPADTQANSGSAFMQYQGVAPSYFQGASLFSRASFSMNGVLVSQTNDYLPQVTAFARRILKPDANEKTFEAAIDFSDPNFAARQARVTVPTGIQQPAPNDRNQTLSIYDLGITYPRAPGRFVTATINAAHTNILLTLSNADMAPAAFARMTAYVKQGMTVTILKAAAQEVAYTATVEAFAAVNAATANITISNATGQIDAGNIVVGGDAQSAQVFFTSLKPAANISNTYEVMFQPPLSIFESGLMCPAGSFNELRLQPYSSSVYQGRAVETTIPCVAGLDFQVQIQQLSFFIYTCAGPRIDQQISYLLPLDVCIGMSTQALTTGANSQAQLLFDVPGSTYCIGIALQNRNLNNTACSSTRFTVGYPSATPALERSVSRLFVTFRSMTQPSQLQTLSYKDYEKGIGALNVPASAGSNLLTKRYMENAVVNGLAFSPGGVESFQDFLEAGPIYLSYWPSDSSSQSSRVTVNITTSEDLSQFANVCLFHVSRQVGTISMEAGRITSVQVQDL